MGCFSGLIYVTMFWVVHELGNISTENMEDIILTGNKASLEMKLVTHYGVEERCIWEIYTFDS